MKIERKTEYTLLFTRGELSELMKAMAPIAKDLVKVQNSIHGPLKTLYKSIGDFDSSLIPEGG
tara:strand:- start:439 stop:627 length:189 start_codon:yes stop_codon:yes gene_type:complete